MRNRPVATLFVLLVFLLLGTAYSLVAQTPPPVALTEVMKLRAEIADQKATIVRLNAQLALCQLAVLPQATQEERAALDKKFREELKDVTPQYFLDWEKRAYVPTPQKR